MPYAGIEVSMVVVLPDESVGFSEFERSLDAPRLVEFADALETREGSLSLPRFGFESSFALQDVLSELGAEVAFDPDRADFGGIADIEETNENLYIYDVYHDTFIEVDEKGTEAAAATGVVICTESGPANPFEIVVDRPFVFFIRDRRTGSILFFGRVLEPKDPVEGLLGGVSPTSTYSHATGRLSTTRGTTQSGLLSPAPCLSSTQRHLPSPPPSSSAARHSTHSWTLSAGVRKLGRGSAAPSAPCTTTTSAVG